MSVSPPAVESCPVCGGPVHHEGGWPAWCPACEWGLGSPTTEGPKGRWRKWQSERGHARVLATHRELLGHDLRASGSRRVIASVLAVLVHGTTLLLVFVAGWLWTTSAFFIAKVVGTLLFGAIAWEVRPRLGRIPRDTAMLSRPRAPATFAVLDAVAEAVGARTPDFVGVTAKFNASVERVGLRGRRVLRIGLPLWGALSEPERLALLGHECGHDVNGDLRSTLLVGTAIQTLHGWASLLRPEVMATRRRWRYGAHTSSASLVAIAEYLVPLVLLPLSVTVGLLAVGLARIAAWSGQRAEYRADELAARAGGSDAAISLLDQFSAAEGCLQAMHVAARAERNGDVFAAEQRFLHAVTPAQRERWRRMAAREMHRTDATHPPTLLRQEMLRSRPSSAPRVALGRELTEAMTAELHTFSAVVARALRDIALP